MRQNTRNKKPAFRLIVAITIGCLFSFNSAFATSKNKLSKELRAALDQHSEGRDGGWQAFKMPKSHQLRLIPQDQSNPLTKAKIELGRSLYHETDVATRATDPARAGTYSCATCHHAAAGFKAGIPQGIADGGIGFASNGSKRRLAEGMDANAADGEMTKPDIQPVASPTVLNSAYQSVMLWNGSFGNSARNENPNAGIAATNSAGPAGIKANLFGLSGLETQAIAGTKVHRLDFDNQSVLQTNRKYRRLYKKAYRTEHEGVIPQGSEVTRHWLGAAKAIAAYERTILANQSPFQRWLQGNRNAMSKKQLRGALLFFGKADCAACHTGPALSSWPDETDNDRIFQSVGFSDFDTDSELIHGTVPENVSQGRGGFTGSSLDFFKFKVPQLYNLSDARVLGHGASFKTVRQVVEYKNKGVPQRYNDNLSDRFTPLGLNKKEISDLVAFVKKGLYDARLYRYVPRKLPSGECFPAADLQSVIDLGCW